MVIMNQSIENFNLYIEKTSGKDSFSATVKDDSGHPVARNDFLYHRDRFILQRLEESVGQNIPGRSRLIKNFGTTLYDTVFTGEVKGCYESLPRNGLIRLRLFLKKEEPDLHSIPWEFIHDGRNFLAAYPGITLIRLIEGLSSVKKEKIEDKIKILVVISIPLDLRDQGRLQIERELEILLQAVDRAVASDKIDIDFEDEASLKNIQARLDEEHYHILHYTGHGVYRDDEDMGYLLLEDDSGRLLEVPNDTIAALLAGYPSLRLVVLSGCQTAKTSGRKSFSDLATPLLLKGIPSVIAMQYSILDDSAIHLANKFYTEIGSGTAIDMALTRARKELLVGKGGGQVDFATPVLFASDPDCLEARERKPLSIGFQGIEPPIFKPNISLRELQQLGV